MEDIKEELRIDLDHFLNKKMAQIYICPICLEIPNPYFSVEHRKCGKIFCQSCIEKWRQNSSVCPQCKQKFSKSDMDVSLALRRTMLNLFIICPNVPVHSKCCPWEGEWEQFPIHNENCLYSLVACPNNCGEKILRKDLSLHITTSCSNKLSECSFCKQMHNLKDIEKHEGECELNMDAVISCKYANAGCNLKMKRKEMEIHEKKQKNSHLNLLLEYSKTLEKNVKKFEEEEKKRESVTKCQSGHTMNFLTHHNSAEEYVCDICEVCNPYEVGSWRCDPCNYDMCNVCYNKKYMRINN